MQNLNKCVCGKKHIPKKGGYDAKDGEPEDTRRSGNGKYFFIRIRI